jgi:hypothetical protein
MLTYLVPVALLLGHGKATNNNVKVEFHFEADLPPAETVSGNVGPTRRSIRARVPELPYQFVLRGRLKLHTSAHLRFPMAPSQKVVRVG